MSKSKMFEAQDMTKGNPYGLYIRYAIPLLLGNIFQQLYNIVDTVVVGNVLGKNSLAAVGSGFPFLFLLTSVFIGLGIGSMIVVSQLAGQGDRAALQRLLGTIYRLLLFTAIPLSLLGVLFAGPVLQLLQVQDPETLQQATLYMQVVCLGILGTFGFNVNAGFLQGIGDSASSLLFLALATGINIVLDLVLTILIPLGVLGVAIATTFAQTFAWVFGIFYINRRYDYLHIHLGKLPFDRDLLMRSIRLGIPSSVQQLFYAFGNMVVQAYVNANGAVFTAGFVAANKVDTFVFLPILSMATAMTTFVGQNVGKGHVQRLRQGTRAGMILMACISIGAGALVYLLRVPSLEIFNGDSDVVQAGLYYLEAVLPFYLLLGIQQGFNGIFQGAGETLMPMIVTAFSMCLIRVPALMILSRTIGTHYIYLCYASGWAFGVLVNTLYYWSGRWKRKLAYT